MLTFIQIKDSLQQNKTKIFSGRVKLNTTPISGVRTLGPNQEVWVIPLAGGENIKVQPADVINVDESV
jgi:hypothetical protein